MAREERVRFRYGICLNDSCSKCKTKEVQEIPARKELVCAECGKPLRECPPPPPPFNWKLYGGIAAVVLGLGGGAAAMFMGGGEEAAEAPAAPQTEQVDSTKTDSTQVAAPVEEAPAPETTPKKEEPKQPATSEPKEPKQTSPKNPSWGSYSGERNAAGKPNGSGILKITRSTTINGETAQPGERIEGVFRDGYVNMGKWYKSDGNVVVIKDLKVI